MKIKTRVRYHCTPTGMTKIKKTGIPNVSKDVKKAELLHTAGGNIKWNKHFGFLFVCF